MTANEMLAARHKLISAISHLENAQNSPSVMKASAAGFVDQNLINEFKSKLIAMAERIR